jgi:hypothetical protein
MRVLASAAVLSAGLVLVSSGAAFSGEREGWGLPTPVQAQAYHECLYAAWVEDYCRANSKAVGACIIANGGGRFPLSGRRFTDDYCWYAAQDQPLR